MTSEVAAATAGVVSLNVKSAVAISPSAAVGMSGIEREAWVAAEVTLTSTETAPVVPKICLVDLQIGNRLEA